VKPYEYLYTFTNARTRDAMDGGCWDQKEDEEEEEEEAWGGKDEKERHVSRDLIKQIKEF